MFKYSIPLPYTCILSSLHQLAYFITWSHFWKHTLSFCIPLLSRDCEHLYFNSQNVFRRVYFEKTKLTELLIFYSTYDVLTWLIMKMFGILFLSFLWLRNTTMTVKFVMIPTEATELWTMRTAWFQALSLLELFDIRCTAVKEYRTDVSFSGKLFEFVLMSIVRELTSTTWKTQLLIQMSK